jgi:hypothetical protein
MHSFALFGLAVAIAASASPVALLNSLTDELKQALDAGHLLVPHSNGSCPYSQDSNSWLWLTILYSGDHDP